MNKKTFIIIGVFICLLFAIPMASATDVDVHNGLAIESAAADFSMDAVNNASVEDSNSIVSNSADSSDSNIIPDNNNLSGIQYDSADVKNSKNLAASNDNVLGADGTGNTFADLQYLIDHASGTLNLDRDFNVSGSDDDHANGIIINNTLTINGGGHTIDAKNLARIFNISASNVQLNNLILINGKSAENGGAIYIQTQGGKTNLENITLKFCEAENGGGIYTVTPTAMKNITAINCTATGNGGAIFAAADGTDVTLDIFNLYNNTAVNGGALYTHGDNIKITNVDAQNNTASGQGGAVYAYGNHLTLDGIKFIRNHAGINTTDNSSGGAIYFDTSSDSIVNNVLFDNNYATKNGGAIAWARGSYFGELYNSNFTNNSAGRSGGAVRWVGDNGTIENCTFIENRANGTNRDPDDYYDDAVDDEGNRLVKLGGSGGAVIWLGSIGYIKNSNFTDNYAALNGGAAFFRAESDTDQCNDTHIIGCNFINNNAESNGGAIGWNDRASHGSLQDSSFINNTAGRSGGAVFWKGSNGTITNSNFTCNHANGTNLVQPPGFLTKGGNGGAIIITGSDVNITYSKFVNNTARARGGAVYLQNNSNTLILNSTFEENFAGTNGGALDFYQGAANGRVINSTFLHNMANKTGGSIYWNGHNGVINGSLFRDNIALNQGTELNGTPITDAGDGGAVIWTGSYGTIENTTFINNTANRRGGAIYLLGESNTDGTLNYCENVTVKNCTFDSNIARTNGGAIDWFKGARYGTVEDSVFINNIANRTGGAIFWNGINGTVRKSNFTNNTAKGQEYGITPYGENTTGGDGGAIMWSGSNGLIDECNFDNNSAKWRGGAMFLQRYDDNILCENTTVSNSNFTFNHAGSNGGAIEWTLGARYGDLVNSTFINNTADRSGGAVFWYGMYGDINGSTFINNSAIGNYTPGSDNRPGVSYLEDGQYSGGAVYVRGDHTVIYNDTFLSNSVPRQGGAIFIKGENATIDKCNFTNHTSQLDGGAIYVDGNITHISNSSFVNNTAETGHGGAIYWEGFNGTVESSNFTHNNNQKGGAIYIDGNLTKINDCNFTNNTATQGGAILVQGNNATINLSNFIGHHTDEEGGAVYVNGTGTQLENSTFTNNTSHDDGGAIAWWGDNGIVYNITCLNNSGTSEGHTSSGGTISIYGSNIVMDHMNITEGYVIGRQDGDRERVARGGAIFLTGNNVTISNSIFTNCTVNSTMDSGITEKAFDGGALYIIGNESKLINNTITGSIARDGGAIHLSGNDGYINGLNASENTATDAGGVLYISGNNTTVANSTFNNNTAWDDGAAIDWIGNDGKMFNVTASDNKGISIGHTSKGGTFSIEGNNTNIDAVNVTNSYVSSSELNRVSQGGGMLVSGNNANISNIAFNNCSVIYTGAEDVGDRDFDGGALIIFGNNTHIENATISNSTTPHNGGGILLQGNDAYIDNIIAADNNASMVGGAMMIFGNHTTLGNSTFSNNTAIAGGAVYWQGNNGFANNASFIDNYATDDGGALFVNGTNDTIANSNFTSNYAYDDGGAIKWEGNDGKIYNLTASDNYGNSVSESSRGGTLYISGNNTVIDGLNITGSYVMYDENPSTEAIQGGAVYLSGNDCNITNVNISDSHVLFNGQNALKGDEASGGAIYIVGNNTNIVNGTFSKNTAWADAGALFVAGENCTMNNTNFTDNVAHNDGGAIQIEGNNAIIYNLTADSNYADSLSGSSQGGTIIITGNNTSLDVINISNSYVDGAQGRRAIRGGAIFLTGNDCNITNASFENCSVKWEGTNSSGGALYILGNNTNVINANFTNNSAPNDGGAVFVSGSYATIDGANFTNNTAKLRGGAIFLTGTETDNCQEAVINNSYFESNHAGGNGGAIDFFAGANDGYVQNSNFVNNTADGSGGAVYWNGTYGHIITSNFTGSRAYGNATNNAISPNKGRGGSIIWLGNDGEILECVFDDSQSSKEGSAMYVIGDRVDTYYSNFTNSQTNSSGTIYLQGAHGRIQECYMENVTAKTNGGGIYIKGNYETLQDILIVNASSTSDGSGIYVTGNSTTVKGCNVTESSTKGDGTILIAGYNTKMSDCNVVNNTAKNGGAVKVTGSNTQISNSNFTFNNVTGVAGGVYIVGNDTTITTSNISDNYASSDGGGVYYSGSRFTLSDSNIDHNDGNRGANIYLGKKSQSSTIIGCNITNAHARNFGGGVEWDEDSVDGLIKDCYFYNLSAAAHGGAIHWWPGTNNKVDNCIFEDCYVDNTKNGGAIYAGATTGTSLGTTLSNSIFINCTSGSRGAVNWNVKGGLIVNNTFINCSDDRNTGKWANIGQWGGRQALQIEGGDNTQIIGCDFYNCTGVTGGGALRVNNGKNIIVANCSFDNCTNIHNAGAVYVTSNGVNITFENNTFTNNNAPNVGALYVDSGTSIYSFVNNTFINNTATGDSTNGGAAQLPANTAVYNSTFIENSCNAGGGAIYVPGNLLVSGSTFENNTAKTGGAINADNGDGDLTINESTFQYNKAEAGSAIIANNVAINDSVLLENQALFDKFTNNKSSLVGNHVYINGTFVGKDNLLNAIYANAGTFRNVTYCGVNGGGLYEETTTNTDDVLSGKSYNEVHQIVILEIYDTDNNLVGTESTFTDSEGKYYFDFALENANIYSFKVYHPEDNYYTGAEYTIGRGLSQLVITSENITHPEDENIIFEVIGVAGQVPTGNITVYINDTDGNVIYSQTIELNDTAQKELILPRLNATEYYIYARYNGDDNYLPDNETSIFHVSMAESFINIGIENYTYNETRNITITVPYIESGKITVIVSNENFTQLYTIYVSEGTEEVQIQLPILDAGEYEIEAIFHGNNNYFPSQNTTNFTVYKAASIINVSAENVSGGVNPIVNIHVDPEVATQNINVTVYDEAGNIVAQYEDLGLHDSSYSITLPVLPKGKYNVTVHYSGDKNHNESDNDTIFYVTNNLFPIEINATNMTYGEDQIINITVPANAVPDKLWIKLNGTENKTVTDLGLTIDPDTGLIQIDTSLLPSRLDVGNYTIDVYYEGDDDYLSNSSSAIFEVTKAIPDMNVTPNNITYGNLEDILVEIAQNGNVTLCVTSESDPTLNISKVEVEIVDGKVNWNVNGTYLPAGEYTVEAIFNGNNNYESLSKREKFNVTKAVPNIVIDVDNIHVGDSEYINVTVEGVEHGTVPEGNIRIIVRTINEIVELNSTGQYNLTLDDEVQGHGVSVTVIYYGDDNYNYTEESVYYDVTKKETSINVTGDTPIYYGTIENLLAEVNETGVTGTITIYVNSSTVDGFINQTHVATLSVDSQGRATWDINQIILPVGSYDVTAVYSGDEKYEGSTSTVKVIVVEKATDYEISVEANNTVYGTDQVIIVTVPSNANGTVTITIAGTGIRLTKDVENGKAVFTIPTDEIDCLEVHDDYNVTAIYNGDDKYEAGQTASDLFNVTKAESHIKVVAEDIDYTQIENITVSLPDTNATGKIVITITNKSDGTQIVPTFEVNPFVNTTGVIYPFEDLLAGNYTVKVEYSEDPNYKDSEDSFDFEVRKVNPTLTENSPDIVYGIDENITVVITGVEGGLAPTGTIEVKVDGVTIKTITIGEEDLEYNVTKPAVDPRHNVTVIYSGDNNYNPVTITGEFAVNQNSTFKLEEDSPNIVYGRNETITITLPNDATGTVYLVVNGSYYTPIGIDENHQAIFTVVAPIVGNYNFTAYYSGDGNYKSKNVTGEFNVTKSDVTLIENHAATITYGENNTITVTITGVEGPEGVLAPTGTIKVLVDGKELDNITIGNDLVFTSIKPFADPQHNITVIYSGDNNYNDKTIDDGVFEVIKNTTVEISEISPNINYGENETITVTIAGDATGTITVKIGDETVGTFSIAADNITEEDKVFEFIKVKPDGGDYNNLVVDYGGDSNYNARSITGEFTVNPIDPNIIEDSPDIVYTNNETIAITVPEGATGTLTVTVKNSKGNPIVDGKVLTIGTDELKVFIEKPVVDNYTIEIEYSGCANFTAKTITGGFNVTKASSEIAVAPTNITYGQTETIIVTVPEGATGSVTISIGSYIDTADIAEGASEVVFTIPKTAADALLKVNENYVVFANYSGDDNFESAIANAPFHVDPANTTLTIVVANITYGEDEIINITVNGVENGDVPTGFVTIKLNGTVIELSKPVDGEGKVQFNVTGLVVGEYTVNATFASGSINYNGSNNTAGFNVTKADIEEANMNITAVNITYGDDETITVIFNEYNVTGNVTITINGTEIETKELEDGKVIFTVPDLEVNGYNVIANYSGDHNYNAITIGDNFNTDFKVDKANVTVEVTPVDIIYKETEEINVTVAGVFINDNVKDNLTGKVTIYIDGVENQTKDISAADGNGILHFSVEGLAVGTHNVTAVYHDDRNYNDKNDTKDFEVINALPENMQVIPQNITYHIQNETITVDLGEVLNGTIQLYINDTIVATFNVIDKSSVSYTNSSLAVGNYTAKAVFTANGDSVEASANFTVSKASVTVTVVADDSTYGETQNITVTVDNTVPDKFNLTGNVSITINGVDYGNKTVNSSGQAVFEIDGLEANENYVVIATYYNDSNYLDKNGQDTFKVSKADVKDTNKNITAINITYGEDETITVTLNEDNITGKVTITINGSEIDTKELEDGKAVFTVKDLEVNGYNVVANYSGDVNYNPFTIADNLNTDFTVGKANSTIEVEAIPSIVYGNNETITVTVPITNATGTLVVRINGSEINRTKFNGENSPEIVINVADLAVGEYNVTAEYIDDVNYNNSANSSIFHVDKANITDIPGCEGMTVVPTNISYLDNETVVVTVDVPNATGLVTITINGTDVVMTKNITENNNGSVTFTVPGLAVGEYNVTASYHDDANYNDASASALFNVSPINSTITVVPTNISYLDDEIITVTVPITNASGKVVVKVDGNVVDERTVSADNPSFEISVSDLAAGEHNVTVEYFDDVNYNNSSAEANFTVSKRNITDVPGCEGMTVVPTNISYLDNETVVVTVDVPNATGLVTITINGTAVELTKNITEEGSQSVTFTVPGLAVGEYNVTASYHDDANYNDASVSELFHVSPINSTVTVSAINITYGDNETITVTVPITNASGRVVVKVNGSVVDNRTVSGDNPSYEISVSDLAAGEYNVTVEYFDDVNYNNSTNSTKFNVSKANITDINLTALSITYGENGTVTITINDKNATGNITIKVNGTEYGPEELVDGTISFNVPNLVAGDYNVTAYYSGDDNYNATEAQTTFNVDKATPTVYAVGTNITYGSEDQITVIVDGKNITGNVTIFIDGDEIDTKDLTQISTGGRAVFNVPGLTGGNHTVVAVYNGDDNHHSNSGEDKFTVSRVKPSIDVNTTNIDYGEVENINITVNPVEGGETPTGNVTVTVTGPDGYTKTFDEVPIVDGNITIPMEDLPAGNYSVNVTYNGDENYNAANGTGKFSIAKIDPTVNIDVSNITYGENETITVTVTGADGKAVPTGTVNITVNGVTYEDQELTDGKVTITVPGLTPDTYPVSVSYGGDENYTAQTGSGEFVVSKANATMNVNTTDIDYGETETVTVNITGSGDGVLPTGTVNITVTDKDGNNKTFEDVEIEDGIAKIDATGLPAGDYDVTVTYPGDDNYNASTATGSFSVGRIAPAVDVSCVNITYGENETITVTVTGADGKAVPTGTVNITVNGETYEDQELTDGKVTITVPGLTPDTYPVSVSYGGDENYTAQTGSGEFVVSKANATMNVNTTNIDYGETETITVNITGSGDGVLPTGKVNITVTDKDGNNKTFEDVEIEDGIAKVNATDLPAGDYDVAVTYPGDDNYNASSATGSFSVGKIAPAVDVSCVNITYGDNETITVTVTGPDGKAVPTGKVNITVDGVTYEDQELTDGKVTITVPGLTPDTYPVSVSYGGDENYTSQTGSGEFVVSKANATMNVNTTNIDYGETETITVNITGSGDGVPPTGKVNITVTDKDGNKWTFNDVEIEDGIAKIDATGLPAGDYDVAVAYPGDDNYNASTATGSFSVGKVDPVMDLETENITYGESETIKVTLGPAEGGSVPTGTVNITVTDKNGNPRTFTDVPLENGVAEIPLSDLAAGNYTVEAKYSGDNDYNADTVSGKFEVEKAVPHVNIYVYDIIYGDVEELRVTCDAPGTIDVIVNGEIITISLDDGYEKRLYASILAAYNGKARVDLVNLAVGTYPAIARYNGNENYTEARDVDVFHVIKENTTTKISVDDIKVGEDAVINIEVDHDSGSEKINANITVTVDGTDYTVELKDGKGTLTVPGLSAGTHTVNATYPGSHNYTESSNKTSFKVSKHDSTIKITTDDIKVGDDETITVKVPKDATGNVTITVNGKDYTAPVKDGKATFTIPGLKAGTYAVNASYSGDDKYKSSKAKGTFKVSKIKPSIDVDAPTIHEGEDGTITVDVPDDATGTITIEIEGRKYTSRIKNGKAVFHISGLSPGKHNIKVYYSGDDKYQSRSVDGGVINVIGDNHGGNHSKHGGINLSDKKTGNPLIMLVLVFFALVIVPFKRSKKDDDEEEN